MTLKQSKDELKSHKKNLAVKKWDKIIQNIMIKN